MRRQEFKTGETVGAGFVVTDPERRVVSTNGRGNRIWGIEIKCPHCAREFVSPIHKIRNRVACSHACAAAAGLMGHQKGKQGALRQEAEADAERRLAPARRKMRRDHQEILTQALEAFGRDWQYAEAMALDAVHLGEAKAAGERSLIWMRASAEVRWRSVDSPL